MKAFAVVCLFVVGASAQYYGQMSAPVASAPASYGYGMQSQTVRAEQVPILSYTQSLTGGVSDSHSFSAGNGIQQSENTQVVAGSGRMYDDGTGQLVKSDSSLVKSGSVSYTSPEGIPITLSYTADEDGFKPSGSHLPVAPAPLPMPQELAAAYAQAASDYQTAAAAAAAAPDMPQSYNSYSAPAPSAPVQSYSSYSAPAPAAPVQSYSSYSAPAVRVQSYSAPAPVQQEIRMSYASAPVRSGY